MTDDLHFPQLSENTSVSLNVYSELVNFTLEGYIFDRDVLFVTFEPAGVAQVNNSKMRSGWGEHLFRKLNVSCLCVKAHKSNWYLEQDLAIAFEKLQPFLKSFKRVITYGGSMGGFGALAYADALNADTVVSINPQSTLDRRIVLWEDRYPVAQEKLLDFSNPFSDAVGKYSLVRRVYIFSDRRYDFDNKHLQRLEASNVTTINTPYIEHQVPEHLARIGALGYIVKSVIRDDFSPNVFYNLMRKRRMLKRYFNVLEKKASGNKARLEIIAAHKAKSKLLGQD